MIDGPKALVAAVAAGKISVRGDVVALRPAAERIVTALQRGAPIAVDAVPEKRTDGVLVYAVRDGDRRAARRYREFRALRKRLVATENGHAKDVLKIPFPVKGPVLQPERRRRALDKWLRRVAAVPLFADGEDAVRAFAGDDDAEALDARLAAVEKRALEPELAAGLRRIRGGHGARVRPRLRLRGPLQVLLPAARGAELPVLLEAGALLRGGPREGGRLPGPVLALHARVDGAAPGGAHLRAPHRRRCRALGAARQGLAGEGRPSARVGQGRPRG